MKRLIFIIQCANRRIGYVLILLIFPQFLFAQSEVRLTGYLEHQYSLSYNQNRWTHLDYDRVRLDVSASAGRSTRVAVAGVAQVFRGDTGTLLRDVLPDAFGVFVDSVSIPIEDRFYLNHAYFTLRPGPLELTVGKQYLNWGAALAFNPTELFRPKNVLEPTYEREGIGAVTARLALGTLSDVMIGFVPDGNLADSGKLIRLRHHISGYDLSALVATLNEPVLPTMFLLFGLDEQRRFTVGGDITGELFDLGVWAEATWSDLGGRQWVEATVGGNYTLTTGTTLMVESHYNGRGSWGAPYSPVLWAGRLTGALRSMSKLIVYAAASHPVDDFQLWNAGLSGIVSAADGSAVFVPTLAYAFAQDVDLLFNGLIYVGPEDAEFAGGRYGGFLRGRVYF